MPVFCFFFCCLSGDQNGPDKGGQKFICHEARYTEGYQSGLDRCHEARYILCDISLGLIRFFRGHVFAEKKNIYIYILEIYVCSLTPVGCRRQLRGFDRDQIGTRSERATIYRSGYHLPFGVTTYRSKLPFTVRGDHLPLEVTIYRSG